MHTLRITRGITRARNLWVRPEDQIKGNEQVTIHPVLQQLATIQSSGSSLTTSRYYEYTIHPVLQQLALIQSSDPSLTTSRYYEYTIHPVLKQLQYVPKMFLRTKERTLSNRVIGVMSICVIDCLMFLLRFQHFSAKSAFSGKATRVLLVHSS